MWKIHVLLNVLKNFLVLILIESFHDSWIFNLIIFYSWFLKLESWILKSNFSWFLKCSWLNLELILLSFLSSSLLSSKLLESILIYHHEACFYILLILCSKQWSASFFKGLDVIFIPLCIFFYILYMYESFLLITGDFIMFVMLNSIWSLVS